MSFIQTSLLPASSSSSSSFSAATTRKRTHGSYTRGWLSSHDAYLLLALSLGPHHHVKLRDCPGEAYVDVVIAVADMAEPRIFADEQLSHAVKPAILDVNPVLPDARIPLGMGRTLVVCLEEGTDHLLMNAPRGP
jgi:hypothetical protein